MWSLRGVHTFSAVSLSLPVRASFVCSGTYHSSNVTRLHKASQIRLSARDCVFFFQGWSVHHPSVETIKDSHDPFWEISKIREKHGELGWLRGTSLAEKLCEEFWISGEFETEWMTSHLWETDEPDSHSWESLPTQREKLYSANREGKSTLIQVSTFVEETTHLRQISTRLNHLFSYFPSRLRRKPILVHGAQKITKIRRCLQESTTSTI